MPNPEGDGRNGQENGHEEEAPRGNNTMEQFVTDFTRVAESSKGADRQFFLLMRDVMKAVAERDRLVDASDELRQQYGLFFGVEPVPDQLGTEFASYHDSWVQGVGAPMVLGRRNGSEVSIVLDSTGSENINPEKNFNMSVFGADGITFTRDGKLTFQKLGYLGDPFKPKQKTAIRNALRAGLTRIRDTVNSDLASVRAKVNPS